MLQRPPLNLASFAQASAKSLRALWPEWFDTPPSRTFPPVVARPSPRVPYARA